MTEEYKRRGIQMKKTKNIPIKMDGTYAYCPMCKRSIYNNWCLSCEKKGKGLWSRLKIPWLHKRCRNKYRGGL